MKGYNDVIRAAMLVETSGSRTASTVGSLAKTSKGS